MLWIFAVASMVLLKCTKSVIPYTRFDVLFEFARTGECQKYRIYK